MALQALEVALAAIRSLSRPLDRLRATDRGLAEQVRAAASSMALNIGEGSRRAGRDRVQHYRIAAGSAEEARVALRVAVAWGYLEQSEADPCLALLDRVLAMLWRLCRRPA